MTENQNEALAIPENPKETQDEQIEEVVSEHKSWFQRTFSPFSVTSLRNSILTMIISALGTGVFTFHKLFNEAGIVVSLFLIIIYMLAYMLSMDCLIYSSSVSNESRSLNELVRNVLGKRISIIYDIIFFVNNYIVLLAYIATIFNNIYETLKDPIQSIIPGENEKSRKFHFKLIFSFFSLVVLFFLNRLKSLKGLASFSIFSILTFFFTLFLCIGQTPFYYKPEFKFNWVEPTAEGVLTRFGLLIFAYNGLFNFYGMKNSMKNPIVRRLKKVSKRSFYILALIFVSIGFASYLSLGQDGADKLNNLFIYRPKFGETDYMMSICRICLAASLYISFAYVTQPLKTATNSIFNHETSETGNILSSLFFSATPIILIIFFDKIDFFVSFSGTSTTPFIVFIFPCLLGIKSGYIKSKFYVTCMWIWIAVCVILAVVGTFALFLDKK